MIPSLEAKYCDKEEDYKELDLYEEVVYNRL